MMPSRGRFIALHEIKGARIQCGKESPSLKRKDRCDERQQGETAASANDAQSENNQPRESRADPFDAIERMKDQPPNTQRLSFAHTGRVEFDGRFQKADGGDETEPEKGDDEGVESEAAHDSKDSMLKLQISNKIQ